MKNLRLNLLILVSIFFLINEMSFAQVSLEWAKTYSHPAGRSQVPYDIVTDTSGNIYMTGVNSNGYSLNDMVTVKYNSSGQYQWGKTFNLSSDYTAETGKSIALYRNGSKTYIYAAGEVSYSGLTQFLKIIKYSENGNVIWEREYDPGILGVNDILSKVMADASGNCYITGSALTNAYIAKYDSSGTLVFGTVVPNFPGYTYASGNDMTLDLAGNIYVTGSTDSSNTRNFFTFKYNSSGALQWTKMFRGALAYQSTAKSIKIGASGNIYITGEYQSSTTDYMTIKYNALTGDTIWTRKFNGTANGTDYGRLLTLDASENVYVSGITNFTGNGDMATVKYNSSGDQQWVKTFAGPGGYLDDPKDLISDAAGNIYLAFALDLSYFGKYGLIKYNSAGVVQWTREYDLAIGEYETPTAMTLDNSGNVIVTGLSGNVGDFGTIKYNSSGAQQWVVKFYGAQITQDRTNDITTDKNGNVYVIGKTKSGQFGDNIQIIKYNPQGDQKWVYNRGGTFSGYDAYDEGKAIAVDTNGNVYFTGTVYSDPTLYQDIFTGKLDSNGVNVWFTIKSDTNGNDEGNDIALDASGNIFITGQITGAGDDLNYVTIKYNSSGAELWSRTYGALIGGKDVPNSIAVDLSGNVFVTGNSDGAGTLSDIATVKYNSAGVQQWVNRYNGSANKADAGNSIAVDKGGNSYVCGMINQTVGNEMGIVIKYRNDASGTQSWISTVNLTSTTGAENLVSIRLDTSKTKIYAAGYSYASGFFNTDYTLTKLDSAGSGIWQRTYSNPASAYDIAYGLALDKNENSYITGVSYTSNSDLLTVAYNASGTFKWSQIFNGAGNGEDLMGTNNPVAVGLNNNVYVGGSSYDSISGSMMTTLKYKQYSHILSLTAFIEGFYNSASNSMIMDTMTVYLRNITAPYNKVDSSRAVLNSSGVGSFNFSNPVDGINYFIVIKHRNSIETWSNSGNAFSSGLLNYNFSSAANKAFGNNLQQVDATPVVYAIFSGDVNQDGTVDATDLSFIDNDASNFISGYVKTDLTGDDFVDATDAALADNNAANFVSVARP